MGAGVHEREVEFDAVWVVVRVEWMSAVELGAHGVFPLLNGHEGVVEGDVGADVEGGLLVGDGGTEVGGV